MKSPSMHSKGAVNIPLLIGSGIVVVIIIAITLGLLYGKRLTDTRLTPSAPVVEAPTTNTTQEEDPEIAAELAAFAEAPPTTSGKKATPPADNCADLKTYTDLNEALANAAQICILRLTITQDELNAVPFIEFRNLRSLDVSGNNLTSIPNSLATVKNLNNLNISNNNLTEIPIELGQLPHLQLIIAQDNQFTDQYKKYAHAIAFPQAVILFGRN